MLNIRNSPKILRNRSLIPDPKKNGPNIFFSNKSDTLIANGKSEMNDEHSIRKFHNSHSQGTIVNIKKENNA